MGILKDWWDGCDKSEEQQKFYKIVRNYIPSIEYTQNIYHPCVEKRGNNCLARFEKVRVHDEYAYENLAKIRTASYHYQRIIEAQRKHSYLSMYPSIVTGTTMLYDESFLEICHTIWNEIVNNQFDSIYCQSKLQNMFDLTYPSKSSIKSNKSSLMSYLVGNELSKMSFAEYSKLIKKDIQGFMNDIRQQRLTQVFNEMYGHVNFHINYYKYSLEIKVDNKLFYTGEKNFSKDIINSNEISSTIWNLISDFNNNSKSIELKNRYYFSLT